MMLTLYDLVIGMHATLITASGEGVLCFECDLGIMDANDDSEFADYRFPEGFLETDGQQFAESSAFDRDIREKLMTSKEPLWCEVAGVDEAKAIIRAAFNARSGTFVDCDSMDHTHAMLALGFCESIGGNPLNIGRAISMFKQDPVPLPDNDDQLVVALPPETAVARSFDQW